MWAVVMPMMSRASPARKARGCEECILCLVVALETVEEGKEDVVWRVCKGVLKVKLGEGLCVEGSNWLCRLCVEDGEGGELGGSVLEAVVHVVMVRIEGWGHARACFKFNRDLIRHRCRPARVTSPPMLVLINPASPYYVSPSPSSSLMHTQSTNPTLTEIRASDTLLAPGYQPSKHPRHSNVN